LVSAGSPYYMAPEVVTALQRSLPYTAACDWWSLGVVAYELLHGFTPYQAAPSVLRTYALLRDYTHTFRLPDAAPGDPSRGALRALVQALCTAPTTRLATLTAMRVHPALAAVDWAGLEAPRRQRPRLRWDHLPARTGPRPEPPAAWAAAHAVSAPRPTPSPPPPPPSSSLSATWARAPAKPSSPPRPSGTAAAAAASAKEGRAPAAATLSLRVPVRLVPAPASVSPGGRPSSAVSVERPLSAYEVGTGPQGLLLATSLGAPPAVPPPPPRVASTDHVPGAAGTVRVRIKASPTALQRPDSAA
jgi:serine/threonine protein kinase